MMQRCCITSQTAVCGDPPLIFDTAYIYTKLQIAASPSMTFFHSVKTSNAVKQTVQLQTSVFY